MKAISLIISVYKNLDFLELIFQSLDSQTYKNFEVIVAEDCDTEAMRLFLQKHKKGHSFTISHVFQQDLGFRKNKILNQAIRIARHDYLVFIDGDCILHHRFMEEYAKRAQAKVCLFGRRVRLGEALTRKLLATGDLRRLSFFRLLFTRSKRLEDGLYLPFLRAKSNKNILGCNFCVAKADMWSINGFDEDFELPLYGEDTDVRRRLLLIGVKLGSCKFKAIQYHLYHATGDRSHCWKVNAELYQAKVAEGLSFCRNGLMKPQLMDRDGSV